MTGWGPYLRCGRGGGGSGGWWRRGHGRLAGGTGAVAGVALVMALSAGASAVRPGSAGPHGPSRLGAAGIWRVVPTASPQATAKTQSALFGVSLTAPATQHALLQQ
jgi:hypothetical protein